MTEANGAMNAPSSGASRTRGQVVPQQKAPKGLAFVQSDSSGRTPADRRQLIRSHVMRGKNTAKREMEPNEDGPGRFGFWPPSLPGLQRPLAELALCIFHVLKKQPTQRSLSVFIHIKENMYPLERCVEQRVSKQAWFYWACTNTVYLSSLLFAVSAFNDLSRAPSHDPTPSFRGDLTQYFSPRTLRHLRRTMQLLQAKLRDGFQQPEDATTSVVITLALMANAVGDGEACETHVKGLKEMNNRELQLKLCRVDLAWSIRSGCKPTLFDGDVTWSRFSNSTKTIYSQLGSNPPPPDPLFEHIQTLDIKLQNVYNDMRDLAHAANHLIASDDKLQPDLFQDMIMSIQYRLLFLEYPLESQPIQEALRCGLLAFQASALLLVPGLKLRYDFLRDRLRLALRHLLDASAPALRDLKLWLMLVGCVAMDDVVDEEEPGSGGGGALAKLVGGEEDWPRVRGRMKGIMWIDAVHDVPGKRVFDTARLGRGGGVS
ncbi:hypothetical protein N658DRAFT_568072 [Parathielavia hyrcaniae]|uniref:Uncharacterized protein n=1 Tax=Parathielavia hyrcaniae TaxID=113614 RepID=A0AAN6T0H0_9PEZI|nr:hypothetical protein N658DRAFT_568072 [Parathielavia hyrcaniae]